MRFAIGLMAILSFSLVIAALCRKTGAVAAAIYGIAVLSHSLVYSQFGRFYAETALFLIFISPSSCTCAPIRSRIGLGIFRSFVRGCIVDQANGDSDSRSRIRSRSAQPRPQRRFQDAGLAIGIICRLFRRFVHGSKFVVRVAFRLCQRNPRECLQLRRNEKRPDVPLRHFRTMLEDLGIRSSSSA